MKPEYFSQEGMTLEMDALLRHFREHFPGTVAERIPMYFHSCNFEERSYIFYVDPTSWMSDRSGHMGNGAFGVILDHAMGILDIYFSKCVTPTITLQMNLLRGIPIDRRLYVRTQLVDADGTRNSLTVTAWSEGMEHHPVCNATGIYFVSGFPLPDYQSPLD